MDLRVNRCGSPDKEHLLLEHPGASFYERTSVRTQEDVNVQPPGAGSPVQGQLQSRGGDSVNKECQEKEEEAETENQDQRKNVQVKSAEPCEISGDHILFAYQKYDQQILMQIFNPSFFKLPCNYTYFSFENIVPFIPVSLTVNYSKEITAQSPEYLATHLTPSNTDVSYKYFSPTRVRGIMSLCNFCPHGTLDPKVDVLINGHLFYSSTAKAALLPPKLAFSVLAYDAIMIVLAYERGFISHSMLQYTMSIIRLLEEHPSISSHTRKSIYQTIAHRKTSGIMSLGESFVGFRSLITPRSEWSIILRGNLIFYSEKLCNERGCKGDLFSSPGKMVRPGRQDQKWTLAPECCKYREEADIAHSIGGTLT